MCQIERGKKEGDFQMGENEAKIEFVLIKKEHRPFIRDVKAIPGEIQYALVVVDIHQKKIRNVVRKTCIERRKISWLNDVKIRKRFEEK